MKKCFRISQIILVLLSLILFNIAFINEDVSIQRLSIFFTLVVLIVTFPGFAICKKIIKKGDRKEGLLSHIIYYFLITLVFVILLVCVVPLSYIALLVDYGKDFGAQLGYALFVLFSALTYITIIITPYLELLIILLLRKCLKIKEDI